MKASDMVCRLYLYTLGGTTPPLRQTLIANRPKPASPATGCLLVRPRHLFPHPIALHLGDQLDQRLFERGRVFDRKVPSFIMDDPIRRAFSVGFFNKQAIGSQLIDVRIIRRFGRAPRFDLHRDDSSILFYKIIGLACQFEGGVKKRFLQFAPAMRIRVNDAPAGQTGGLPLTVRLPEEEDSEEEEGKGKIEHWSIGELENSCRAIRHQHHQCEHQQNQPHHPRKGRCHDLSPMPGVEFGPGGKLGLVGRFDSLFAVPPGAATVQVCADVGRADDSHRQSIAQIF